MKQYKNYIFSIFFCICSIFSSSFLNASYEAKAEFGANPKSNIVLLSSKNTPTSHYMVLNEEKPTISILEDAPPDIWLDLPKIELYFIRFWKSTKISFQKPEKQTKLYTLLSCFPQRVLRI